MSSIFIKNTKPKTASSWSLKIKPKKKRKQRRPIVNQQKSVEKIPLKKITENPDNEQVGTFLETNWGESIVAGKKYDKKEGRRINHFKTLDSTEDKHILAFDESERSLRISATASREIARRHLTTTKNIDCIRRITPEIIEAKPKV